MMRLTKDQVDELRMGALTAMDGLWFMGVEERLGFDTALEIDIQVWKNYGIVLTKRIARMTGIDLKKGSRPDMHQVKFLLDALCVLDGTRASIVLEPDGTLLYRVDACPWWDNFQKAGRRNHPCEMIDEIVFRDWLGAIDGSLSMEILHSRPRGCEYCSFRITGGLAEPAPP